MIGVGFKDCEARNLEIVNIDHTREFATKEKKEMGQKGGGRRAGESKLSGLPLLLGAISHLDSSILRLIVRKKNTEKITSCHGNG